MERLQILTKWKKILKIFFQYEGQLLIEILIAIGLSAILLPALFTGLLASKQGKSQKDQRAEVRIKKKLNGAGFTLIELIIYMGFLAIMLVIFADIFGAITDNQIGAQIDSNISQDGRYIYSRFIYDVNRASSVSIPANLGDTSPTLTLTIGSQTYTYSLSGGDLLLTDASGPNALNGFGTTVSDLQFKRVGNSGGKHTFQINFTIRGKGSLHGLQNSQVFQITAGLR